MSTELYDSWLSYGPSPIPDKYLSQKQHRRTRDEYGMRGAQHLHTAEYLGSEHPYYEKFRNLGNQFHETARWHHDRLQELTAMDEGMTHG